ncbi:ferredoxin [bacterium]|nr:ferredoxin [bacterium]MBU1025717.1 ferredoxin [bacterium]
MKIKVKVWVDEGCIGCGLCEEICPEVFEADETASVNEENIEGNEDAIAEAAAECPVEVIIMIESDFDLIIDDDEDEVEEESVIEEDEL